MQTRFEVAEEAKEKSRMNFERKYTLSMWVLLPVVALLVACVTLSIITWMSQESLRTKTEKLENITASLGNFNLIAYHLFLPSNSK